MTIPAKSSLRAQLAVTLLAISVTASSLQAVAGTLCVGPSPDCVGPDISLLYDGMHEPVHVVLYGESLCPSCRYFVENIVAPMFDQGLNEHLFRFRYLAYGNARNQSDGIVVCQHGPDECSLNQVINCAQGLYLRQEKWFPYVRCLEASTELDVEQRALQCAKTAGMAWNKIRACAKGNLGVELEVEAAAATAALDPPHIYVPWVTVNDVAIGQGYQFLLTFVCAAYTGNRPPACSQPPPLYDALQHSYLPTPSFQSVRLQKSHLTRSSTV